MCNAEQGPGEWHFYVNHMLEFGEKVLFYTEEMDQTGFVNRPLSKDM